MPLAEVYAFISSLYYRGKRAYARAFGHHPDGGPVALAITPTQGLVADETRVTLNELRAFASCDIDPGNPRYRTPLAMSARGLDQELPRHVELVLLGSIATGKYLDPLAEVFGRRLLIPRAFVGRGDMSRGGLMLRAADAGEEHEYVPALDADRTGPRPPLLDRDPTS